MLCIVVRDFSSIGHDFGGVSDSSDCTLGLHAVLVSASHSVI